ncbi:MAG TPA: cytochrome c biogenesis protein ResB [Holophagaceae bacterium]|nr:cytochrome c biogenesis protein ResB [Holophagaceae bacterium]
MANNTWKTTLKPLASLQLTIVLLALLMALVVMCTLAQVHLGIFRAVEVYMRSFLVWWGPASASWEMPVFPGGALVGFLLLVNLTAAMFVRLEASWRKGGLWLSHIGLILLFFGEFVAGGFQVETMMPVEVGQTMNYAESNRRPEIVFLEECATEDTVTSIAPSRVLQGGLIQDERLPASVNIVEYHRNSKVMTAPFLAAKSRATAGFGREAVAQAAEPAPSDEQNIPSAYVELKSRKGENLGTYLISTALEPQPLQIDGKEYRLAMRLWRNYMPFSLTLKEFRHDKYAGTEIAKNFASLVRLQDPQTKEDRDVLIYMNHPLRYRGRTFFQASFGKGDTLSVFQVVENPGWQIPYWACVIVSLGLAWHFIARLLPARRSA